MATDDIKEILRLRAKVKSLEFQPRPSLTPALRSIDEELERVRAALHHGKVWLSTVSLSARGNHSADHLPPPVEAPRQTVSVVDVETGIVFQQIGTRQIDGEEWIDLALPNDGTLARSVKRGLFDRIFKPAPRQTADETVRRLYELADWFDSRERETFRHRLKDDGVVYTPYRMAAKKLRELLPALPTPREDR